MNQKNIDDIEARHKVETLRPVKPDGKGYFKIGSVQQIKLNLFASWKCKVKILSRDIINLDDIQDYKPLGYDSKEEYLNEPFNLKNPSNLRVKYKFELIEVKQ